MDVISTGTVPFKGSGVPEEGSLTPGCLASDAGRGVGYSLNAAYDVIHAIGVRSVLRPTSPITPDVPDTVTRRIVRKGPTLSADVVVDIPVGLRVGEVPATFGSTGHT